MLLQRLVVDLLKHGSRAFADAIGIDDGDAVGAEAGGDGGTFAFAQ